MIAADLIPALTGLMIFISVLLAGRKTERSRKQAWILGLASQLLLITFGLFTGHALFLTHALVAGAFAYNLWPAPVTKLRAFGRGLIGRVCVRPRRLVAVTLLAVLGWAVWTLLYAAPVLAPTR